MREFTIVAVGTHVEQLFWNCIIEDEVAMEKSVVELGEMKEWDDSKKRHKRRCDAISKPLRSTTVIIACVPGIKG